MSFDLAWIRSFIALARTRNFSKAAAQNNVTQPAFSRRIRALEAWLGSDLIDRSTYPTRLTPAGERFLGVADDIDRKLAEVRAEIAEASPAERERVVIAAQHTLACGFLPAHLGDLRQDPDSPLCVVHAENIHDCSERLIAGNADILLAFAPANGPPRLAASDVECRRVGRDRLVPVVAPDPAGGPRHTLGAGRREPVPWLSFGEGTLLGRACTVVVLERDGRVGARPHVPQDAIDAVCVLVVRVPRQLVLEENGHQGAAGQPHGEADDVHRRVAEAAAQGANREAEVGTQHKWELGGE
jgi:DNA-binding transcriptional LysR family regulator